MPQPDPAPIPPHLRHSRLHAILPLPTGKPLGILILAIMALLASVILIEMPVLHHTNGNVLYPLDNAFVNITVARNLAFYQVWGISKYAFQSAATSLLYPITLAPFFFIAGAHLVIPLIVNFLAAAYFLLMLQKTLIRCGLSPLRQLVILLGAMLLTLLPLLVVSGMEYVLQLLFVFLFVDSLLTAEKPAATAKTPTAEKAQKPTATAKTQAAKNAKAPTPNLPRHTYLYALLAVAARYEDILIIALACLLLGRQKNWKTAAKLAGIALSPVIVFGIISLLKKSYFLPNALLLGPYPIYALILTVITVAAAAALITRSPGEIPQKGPANTRKLTAAVLVLLAIPFSVRNGANLAHFEQDCDRIYDVQFPTANFIHLYYYKSTVGINEPGAAGYFSEGRKLDYTGLASLNVTQKKYQHIWSPRWADSLSRTDGIRAAIVTDPWFSPSQLPRWTRIASWAIPGNTSNPEKTINFYAINQYDTSRLRKYLQEYQAHLPAAVSVRYY